MGLDYSQALANFGFKYTLEFHGRHLIFSFLSDKQRAWYEVTMKKAQLEEINRSELLLDGEREKSVQSSYAPSLTVHFDSAGRFTARR